MTRPGRITTTYSFAPDVLEKLEALAAEHYRTLGGTVAFCCKEYFRLIAEVEELKSRTA